MKYCNGLLVLALVSLSACGGGTVNAPALVPTPAPSATPTPGGQPIPGSKVQHVIVVIQENRTLDNMFNGFPGANTVLTGEDHNGNPVALQPHGLEWQFDPSHSHASLVTEYNNGGMNGFDLDTCDFNPLSSDTSCDGLFTSPPPNFTYA